jgi:predicted nucleic acid-binding protein
VPHVLDTGFLVRLVIPTDPHHSLIRAALRTLRQRGEERCYTSQNLAEFWNLCTRPVSARGGYGLSVAETDRKARLVERLFTLPPLSIRLSGNFVAEIHLLPRSGEQTLKRLASDIPPIRVTRALLLQSHDLDVT